MIYEKEHQTIVTDALFIFKNSYFYFFFYAF